MSHDRIRLVLHTLRLRSVADMEVLSARTQLDASDLVDVMSDLEDSGLVRRHDGALEGWSLTGTGRHEGEGLLAEQLDRTGTRSRVEQCYREFCRLNPELLRICSDWQVVRCDGREVVNDHSDPVHDRSVLIRLALIDRGVQPVTSRLAGALERFSQYGERLGTARLRLESGDNGWFTKPSIDSYHTVWFELHEDLLATLGLRRTQEGAGRRTEIEEHA